MSEYSINLDDLVEVSTPDIPPNNDALVCETCGDMFEHTGRGRKPKTCPTCRAAKTTTAPRSSRRNSKDVETALATMENYYGMVSAALMLTSPMAAVAWGEQLSRLTAANRAILAGDPNLTKSICRVGEKSGKVAFLVAHVAAVIPPAMIIKEQLASRPKKPKTVKPAGQPRREAEQQQRVETARTEGNTGIPNAGFFG